MIELIQKTKDAPEKLMVHCSAGVGRSGVFVLTTNLIRKYEQTGKMPTEDEIDAAIIDMRKERPQTVQTAEQRELVSKALKYYLDII